MESRSSDLMCYVHGRNHLIGLKPKFTATLHPSDFTETDCLCSAIFLSARRLIGLLTVRERTATLLKSHNLVSKCCTFPFFMKTAAVPSFPFCSSTGAFAAAVAREGGSGGAPSSNIARRHASSHMPSCMAACEIDGCSAGWTD